MNIRDDSHFHRQDYTLQAWKHPDCPTDSSELYLFAILSGVFVFLSKFLPLFIYPLGLIALLLALALAWRRGRRLFIALALIILWLGGSRYVAYTLVRSLETRYPSVVLPEAGAIVILGGGVRGSDPPRPITEVNEAGDRLLYGAKLYHEGAADLVVVTGGSIGWLTPEGIDAEAKAMFDLMSLLGVPPEAILLESNSRNTYENALYTRQILAGKGIGEIILVTSAMHMPRALPLFEAQGLRVIPAPTDFLVSDAEWSHLWRGGPVATIVNLVPDVEYMTYTTRAIKEYIGLVVYSVRGWS